MASFNRIIIAGNLTRDPEYKQLSSGQATCRLGLASNRQFKNKQTGSMVQEVCYVDIDVWGPQAESCRQYLQKGRAILVEGRLKFDSWKDADGQTRSKHSVVADRVVFLSGPSSSVDITSLNTEDDKSSQKNQLDKDLIDQIDEIKSRAEATFSAKPATVTKKSPSKKSKDIEFTDSLEIDTNFKDEIDFKDEPPFQDDLPF